MFNFTALLGAQSQSTASQSLLELDGGIKILIDVGWDDAFSVESLSALEAHIPSISFILLTHPTLDHLGAFAHLCKHVPQFKSIPVYATSPVVSLGRTLLQDLYASSSLAATVIPSASLAEAAFASDTGGRFPSVLLQAPTALEIAGYFSMINGLKYSQPLQPISSPFSPSVDGMTITAYSAGHTLGGTIWHIQHGLESIVYAVDWNLAKENTLTGAAWLSGGGGGADILEPLQRPTVMICSSKGIQRPHIPGGRQKRDETLLAAIDQTVTAGGIVLIPTDSSARILELSYIVEQFWRKKISADAHGAYSTAKAHLISRTAGSTLRFARSMVEWMDDDLVRETEAANDAQKNQRGGGEDRIDQTPFDFRHVNLVERNRRVQRILKARTPGVILASDTSLEWGFSGSALRELCGDSKNLVILTEQRNSVHDGPHNTISAQLWNIWQTNSQSHVSKSAQVLRKTDLEVTLRDPSTEALVEGELTVYQQYLARRRQIQSTQQAEGFMSSLNPEEAAAADDQSSVSSDSDESDDGQQGRALNLAATLNQSKRKIGLTDAELGINVLLRKKNAFDYDVRGRRGREKIFPVATKREREDEYGDTIRPEQYLRAEEKDEDAQAETKTDDAAGVGQKRKWEDPAANLADGRRQKRKANRQGDDGRELSLRTGDTNGTTTDNADDSSDDSESEAEDVDAAGPKKIVFKDVTLTVNMGICHVDYSGLHEKRDLQMLMPMIKPRKLVITSGRTDETEALASDCRELLEEDDGTGKIVYTPCAGETIDVSVDTNAWTVKLSSALIKNLAWQTVKGLGVVAITARLNITDGAPDDEKANGDGDDHQQQQKKRLKLASGTAGTKTSGPTLELDIVPANAGIMGSQTTQPIHVGDLRLADLRRLLVAGGHVAEFRGEGVLVVDGMVVVRKLAGGRIDVESGAYGMGAGGRYDASATFSDVRRKIYEGLAVVAGG